MTDEEFETLWSLETRETFKKSSFPDYLDLRSFAAKHREGIDPRKLCRRFEVEGYSRSNVQLALGRATDWGFLRIGRGWEIFPGERTTPLEVPLR